MCQIQISFRYLISISAPRLQRSVTPSQMRPQKPRLFSQSAFLPAVTSDKLFCMIFPDPSPAGSAANTTDRFFEPGGLFEQHCTEDGIDFELRPQQQRMARAVADAAGMNHHLSVEAGTGVGKSFAYLVPQILTALEKETRCVIATYTITLQEQLMHKDIPFVRKAIGCDFKAVMVKGRSNYLCLLRLQRARRSAGDLFDDTRARQLDEIYARASNRQLGDGSLQELAEQPDHEVWGSICAEHGNCTGKRCPFYSDCYFMRARQQMQDAQVLVVNHSLFFAELALRAEGAAMLPTYGYVVFDEAHQMEQVASSHLGIRLSLYMIEYWLRRIHGEKRRGLCAMLKDGKGALMADYSREAAKNSSKPSATTTNSAHRKTNSACSKHRPSKRIFRSKSPISANTSKYWQPPPMMTAFRPKSAACAIKDLNCATPLKPL